MSKYLIAVDLRLPKSEQKPMICNPSILRENQESLGGGFMSWLVLAQADDQETAAQFLALLTK